MHLVLLAMPVSVPYRSRTKHKQYDGALHGQHLLRCSGNDGMKISIVIRVPGILIWGIIV